MNDQDFWSITSMLKELFCIFEAPLGVSKFEFCFVVWDLNFPIEQWFSALESGDAFTS
jgi:hypothetical protein